MIIIPAIDIKEGQCVRLVQGRPEAMSVYSDDPVIMAHKWAREGARRLHVVDLDGAFSGRPINTAIILQIVKEVEVPVEVGGGLRREEDIEFLLQNGVRWVIVGTQAVQDPKWLGQLTRRWADRVILGIDACRGRVRVQGWQQEEEVSVEKMAHIAQKSGVQTVIYTDTTRDGTQQGPNLEQVARLCDLVSADVIASGGVSGPEDIRYLRRLGRKNLVGVIVGKALYEGSTTVAELKEAAGESEE